jgi:hypothetical protein
MMTSHAGWFTVGSVLALPIMLAMFRDGGELTRDVWLQSVIFAGCIGVMIAIFFGKGNS